MAKRVPAEFQRTVAEHRNRMQRMVQQHGTSKLNKLYAEAASSLERKLRKAVRAGRGDTFTAYQHRVLLTQVREGMMGTAKRVSSAMSAASKQVQTTALKGLGEDITRLNRFFTGGDVVLPIEEAARFKGIIDARQPSLLHMHQTSMARYGANVVEKVQSKLALSLLEAQPVNEAIDDVAELIDGEWWQGERIVRTELAFAHNATLRDGLLAASEDVDGLHQRWEENCDQLGQPLDNRVGVDSIAMHGQVAPAGGLFVMPPTAPFPDADGNTTVHRSLVGRAWEFPPNRPNDRSVLSPWMKSWGIPGWRYAAGRRVPL